MDRCEIEDGDREMLPFLQLSPASPLVQSCKELMSFCFRDTLADFPSLLRKHIDFDEIALWGAGAITHQGSCKY